MPEGAYDPAELEDLSGLTRRTRRWGYAITVAFFGVGGVWAGFAPLSSAAVAPGVISPDGARRTVQHLEGGIIAALHVREGDAVALGAPLVTLRDLSVRADRDVASNELAALRAAAARLQAELRGDDAVAFPADLSDPRAPPSVREAVQTQIALFESLSASRKARDEILLRQVAQLERENDGLRAVISSQTEQKVLIEKEIAVAEDMFARGLERQPRLLALKRSRSQLDGETASNQANIARNDQAISELELKRLAQADIDRQEIASALEEVRAKIAALDSQLPVYQNAVDRSVVRAPTAGRVVELRFKTEGGVIRAGEAILDIVPNEDALIIDARVKPVDVTGIAAGLEAQVTLPAFSQRRLPRLTGRVRQVSADAIADPQTGQRYFAAQVEVELAALQTAGVADDLVPGMPAEVMIITGERSFLAYLFEPLSVSFSKAFREP